MTTRYRAFECSANRWTESSSPGFPREAYLQVTVDTYLFAGSARSLLRPGIFSEDKGRHRQRTRYFVRQKRVIKRRNETHYAHRERNLLPATMGNPTEPFASGCISVCLSVCLYVCLGVLIGVVAHKDCRNRRRKRKFKLKNQSGCCLLNCVF